jgi:predicted aspartyl protease
MTIESSIFRRRGLILVEAEITGPRGSTNRRLVFDTGAEATTLIPAVIEEIGYSPRDGHKPSKVHSAIGEEAGYWLHVGEFAALGISTPNFALQVFDLGYDGIYGLLGMNFLRHFNFAVRPAERRILAELIRPSSA